GSPSPSSKDVPHLSESVFIGIERWRFVERLINEFARMMNPSFVFDRQSISAASWGKRTFLFRASGRSVRGKCTLHDVIYVRRERRCLHDALQGGLRPRAPHRLHHAPILEGRGKSGRELGSPRVKCKHYVHDEIVAAA